MADLPVLAGWPASLL
ncbi:hypothetical protein YPPY01_4530, partial [Yersinia pestis PY-01]